MQKSSKNRGPGSSEQEKELANLVSQIAEGNESALGALYDLTNRLVFGLALRILSDVADAEEVTLDVFMRVWDRAADYDPERSTPSTWLLMLARSRAIDRLRSGAKQSAVEDLSETDVSSPAEGPEETALFAEKREIVRNALSSLAPQQRKPIELAYFYGLTQSEISKRLGQPLGTVKSSIRLGMMKLRELLGLEAGEE